MKEAKDLAELQEHVVELLRQCIDHRLELPSIACTIGQNGACLSPASTTDAGYARQLSHGVAHYVSRMRRQQCTAILPRADSGHSPSA
jgi:hypothetical protein